MHNKMAVVASKIMNEDWYLEHYAQTFVAQIVCSSNIVACHVIMITHFPPIITRWVERSLFIVTDTTVFRIIMLDLLLFGESSHFAVGF